MSTAVVSLKSIPSAARYSSQHGRLAFNHAGSAIVAHPSTHLEHAAATPLFFAHASILCYSKHSTNKRVITVESSVECCCCCLQSHAATYARASTMAGRFTFHASARAHFTEDYAQMLLHPFPPLMPTSSSEGQEVRRHCALSLGSDGIKGCFFVASNDY